MHTATTRQPSNRHAKLATCAAVLTYFAQTPKRAPTRDMHIHLRTCRTPPHAYTHARMHALTTFRRNCALWTCSVGLVIHTAPTSQPSNRKAEHAECAPNVTYLAQATRPAAHV